MEMTGAGLTWLRPMWLLALLLLPLIWWLMRRLHGQPTVWQRAIDAHLLPHLLQHIEVRGAWRASWLWLLAATLAIVALAGPSWRQQAAPLWQKESPLVIALDLSAAMRATDVPPSRVVQARAKIKDLLQKRRSGQVGLLVYAGDAFTVAPITRDARTVIALLDSLSPDLMPVQGQRGDRAIEHALAMLRDSAARRGDILLISDRADAAAERAAANARAAGVQVSVMGVGTLAGAPLTGSSGFITGADGQAVLARLDPTSLSALATAGGGRYVPLAADDSDLVALQVLDPVGSAGSASSIDDAAGVTRSDDGYWLLLLVLPLMLVGFRRGWLAMLPLVIVIGLALPAPPAAAFAGPRACADAFGCGLDGEAAPQARRPPTGGVALGGPRACAADSDPAVAPTQVESGFSWDSLWRRADQRAFTALQEGDTERARALAPNPGLQGAAAYRGDDFEAAANAWAAQDDADAHYNRGNALARGGKLKEALQAYDEALERSPDMPDAVANRKAVADALRQQQAQDSQKQQGQSGEGGEQEQKDQQKSESEQSDQGDPQTGEGQASDEKSGEQEQSKPGQEGEPESQSEKDGQQDAGQSPSTEDQEGKPESGESASQAGDEQKPADSDGDGRPDERDGESSAKNENPADAAEREAAEAAAKQAMQKALESAQQGKPDDQPPSVPMTAEQRAQSEQRQATEQLLRRVPDDPGALLRRKFEMEYRRRLAEGDRQ